MTWLHCPSKRSGGRITFPLLTSKSTFSHHLLKEMCKWGGENWQYTHLYCFTYPHLLLLFTGENREMVSSSHFWCSALSSVWNSSTAASRPVWTGRSGKRRSLGPPERSQRCTKWAHKVPAPPRPRDNCAFRGSPQKSLYWQWGTGWGQARSLSQR